MIYLRGHPEDYVNWFKDSDLTYNRDILPYIKKLESKINFFVEDLLTEQRF